MTWALGIKAAATAWLEEEQNTETVGRVIEKSRLLHMQVDISCNALSPIYVYA